MPQMTDEHWRSLSGHLDVALGLTEADRERWLSGIAASDPEMAALIAQILGVRERQEFAEFLHGDLDIAKSAIATASMVGRAVGPYVIDAQIGQGGMGTVWRARRADGRFEGTVAVKFVHVLLGGAGEQRFRVEGELLARLDHPNIARLIDAGVREGIQPYLVIEYVEGEPIDAYCRQRELSLDARIELFRNVLAAVSHAHSHLVVHRDIKPANILVTGQGAVKLLDFGIAKLLSADSDALPLTRSSAMPLTPQYAAPEQLLGKDITTATDVYALGLVLYLLLTGTHPIKSDTRSSAELVKEVVTKDPARASDATGVGAMASRALKGDLDNILAKALKKDPAERYQTVSAFSDDLRRFLDDEPVGARPDSLTYRAKKFVRRHRGAVLASSLTLVLLLFTAAAALWQAHRADRERDAALLAARRADSVGDFMSALLSDIGKSGSPEAQREHLDRARALLQQQHYGDPMINANLLHYLAARYQEFGYSAPAIELLQEAKSAADNAGDRIAVAQIGCQLANLYDGLRRADDADHEIRAAMSVLENPRSGVRPQVLADCLNEESYIHTARHENALAIAATQKSVSELEAAGLKSGLEHVTALNALARAQAYAGHYAIAAAVMRQIRSGEADGGMPQTIGAFIHEFNLARYLLAGGRVIEAETMAKDLAAAAARSSGARDVALLRARALLALDRTDDAIPLLEGSPHGAATERVLARVELLLRHGDTAAAQREWSQQETAISALLAAGGENAIGALRVKALLAMNAADPAAAEEALKSATLLTVDVDGLPVPGLRQIEVLRADDALRRGASAKACNSAKIALERAELEAVNVNSSAWIGEALLLRARCEQALGLLDAMHASARAALPHLEQNLGQQHPLAVQARALLSTTAAPSSVGR
jgi:serine/threonine-protein kinase